MKDWYKVVLSGVVSALIGVIGTMMAVQSSNLREQANMVPDLLREIGNLQKEIVQIKSDNNITEDTATAFFKHLPFPAWLKIVDNDGLFRMDTINHSYEQEWGISALQYKNKLDSDLWSKEMAQIYTDGDQSVLDSLGSIIKWEFVPDDPSDPNSRKTLWIVTKFPVEDHYSNNITAIGGIAIPSSIYEIFLENK